VSVDKRKRKLSRKGLILFLRIFCTFFVCLFVQTRNNYINEFNLGNGDEYDEFFSKKKIPSTAEKKNNW